MQRKVDSLRNIQNTMAENLQDLKEEMVKVEVPSLKEMSVDRIFHLLNKVIECQKYFAPSQ